MMTKLCQRLLSLQLRLASKHRIPSETNANASSPHSLPPAHAKSCRWTQTLVMESSTTSRGAHIRTSSHPRTIPFSIPCKHAPSLGSLPVPRQPRTGRTKYSGSHGALRVFASVSSYTSQPSSLRPGTTSDHGHCVSFAFSRP
jgi:hypothetical protein